MCVLGCIDGGPPRVITLGTITLTATVILASSLTYDDTSLLMSMNGMSEIQWFLIGSQLFIILSLCEDDHNFIVPRVGM